MEDPAIVDDDLIGLIDWDNLFNNFHGDDAFDDLFEIESPVAVDSSAVEEAFLNPSPDSVSSLIGDIENYLMNDYDDKVTVEPSTDIYDQFLVDVLVDSPVGEAVHVLKGKDLTTSDDDAQSKEEKENINVPDDNDGVEAANDPVSKKQRRQHRNRDAAVRSRERKKLYVKDLEVKSKYLEAECRRLGRMLQCCVAENQALRFGLQNGNSYAGTMTKQESAVLFLESLLLGSLLWFLAIICPLQSHAKAVLLGNAGHRSLVNMTPRGPKSNIFGLSALLCFIKSRRCKASRTKMKPAGMVL